MKSLASLAAKAHSTHRGVDVNRWIERQFKGKTVHVQLADGSKFTGKLDCAVNAGFSGVEAHVINRAGVRRVSPIARIWVK